MSAFEDYIGYRLIQVMKAHRRIAEPEFAKLGLYPSQEMILMQLWREDGQSQSQLADAVCVEPPTMTKMVQRMAHSGFLERRQDVSDARVTRVYLTQQGRELEQPVRELWANLEAQTVTGLGEAELLLLRRLLVQLEENLAE
jgi:MarR family transcriptional regulator, organic hydroperoxide resistance regulator